MTFITEVTRYNSGPRVILVSRSFAPGPYVARIKSTNLQVDPEMIA